MESSARYMGLIESNYLDVDALDRLFSGGAGSDFVRLLFERAPSGIAIVDREMRYLAVSRRWCEDYGLGDQQILGRSHYELFPDVPERWRQEHARCLAGETLSCEEDEFERADGTSVWIRWEIVPLRRGSELPLGMIMLTEVITRRVEAEAARDATGKTLEIAEEVAHIGTWDWDLRTEKVMCSPVMSQLLGMGDKASIIRIDDLADFLHPEDAAGVRFGINEVRSGQDPKPEIVTRVNRTDGATIWIRLAIRAGRDGNGRIQQVYGTIQDITGERLAHEELAFRDRAFETAASPLTMSTIDAHYTYGNRAFVELLGYASFDEIAGRLFTDFITEPQRVAGSIDALRDTGRWSGELRMVRADGTEFDVAVLAGLVRDEHGEPLRVIVSYLDVTERNTALAELSRRESQLRQAQELARLGPWRYDVVQSRYFIPPETRKILGLGPENAVYNAETAMREVHADDVAHVAATFQSLRRGDADNAQLQYRYLPPGGGAIHLRVMLETERDSAGKVTGLLGLLQDITGFRQLEQAHRETERAMSALMRNLSGMVYRCDNDERWTMRFISDACCRVLGYEVEDLIDNKMISYSDVIDPRDRQRVWDGIQSAIDDRRAFQLSYRVTTKQGDVRWVLEQGSAIRDEHDRVVALEGYVAEITA